MPSPGPSPIPAVASKSRSFGQIFNFLGIVAIHVGTVMAFTRGASLKLVALAAATYFIRIFAITGVYHRYFSHRSYRTSRPFQLFLAWLGTTATQKGPLWWASTHREHHKYSDTDRDVHSPLRRGFWYAHMGWWLGREHEVSRHDLIRDYARYPELRWLDKYHVVGPLSLMGLLLLAGGYDAFLWGFVVSTCFVMHATFTINSLAHVYGTRRYATSDTSRNNFWLAMLTFGEGWHNNHHHYMASARQGFFWWEIDVSFYVIKLLEKVRLVWDVRAVPAHVLTRNLVADVGEQAPLLLGQTEPVAGEPIAPHAAGDQLIVDGADGF